jgi:hypothetical protein
MFDVVQHGYVPSPGADDGGGTVQPPVPMTPWVKVVKPSKPQARGGRYMRITWRSVGQDTVADISYTIGGPANVRVIRKQAVDDGLLRWRVPMKLVGRWIRVHVTVTDRATGHRDSDRSRSLKIV